MGWCLRLCEAVLNIDPPNIGVVSMLKPSVFTDLRHAKGLRYQGINLVIGALVRHL